MGELYSCLSAGYPRQSFNNSTIQRLCSLIYNDKHLTIVSVHLFSYFFYTSHVTLL